MAEEELIVPAEDEIQLPDTVEVEAEREKRRRFDEEWNGINEVLLSIPLEPLTVNISTKPDGEESDRLVPRTSNEMANEILETLNSRFCF